MSIDQLIRDLIEEDQFKAKYTSRQRSIFCNNMYAKVSKFIQETNKEKLEKIDQLEEELAVSQNDLEVYKMRYEALLRESNMPIRVLFYWIRTIVYSMYLYFMWNAYKVNAEISIKETNSTSVIP